MKRQLRCGNHIESQYYNPKSGVKGNRIVSENICAIFYKDEDIVLSEDIRDNRDIGGKNPLLVCRYCFNMNIEIPCSGGCKNQKQKKDQDNRTKRKQLQESVQRGRRKGRKS